MTTNAELADELERRSRHQQDCLARWADVELGQANSSVVRLVTDNLPAILAALRASRPEPAADAVEAVERWRGALISLTPGDDRYADNPEACAAWVKTTFAAQDRMLIEVEAREKKLKREVGTLEGQVKSALADSEERLAEFLEARANSANEKGQPGEYMINMDAALAVRSGILGRRAALSALPRPAVDEGATPCGREGCGHTMACCRPDCPIEMYRASANDGLWQWRRRAALAAAQEGEQ